MARDRSSLLLLFFGVISAFVGTYAKTDWYVGYEKVNGKCVPVGGVAEPNNSPFPFAGFDDCVKGKMADNFDKNAKHWDGYVLDSEEKCVKVWARSKTNPFTNSKLSECEKEKAEMKAALAVVEGSSKVKRGTNEENALLAGKFVVEALLVALSLVNPGFALLIPILNWMWPSASQPSVWEQVRSEVKSLINQKMNEAYAKDLRQFLGSMKRELDTYKRYKDTSSQKLPKLISIDTQFGAKELKFMNKDDPLPYITYYTPYVALRSAIKVELARIAKPSEKQEHMRELLVFLGRHAPRTADIAYSKLPTWRKSQFSCTMGKYHVFRYRYNIMYQWSDKVTGRSNSRKFTYPWPPNKTYKDGLQTWCAQQQSGEIKKLNAFIDSLKKNIIAWGSMFNKVAANPLVKGFSAADSSLTTNEGVCKFPFTYRGKSYSKCTSLGHNQPWCYKVGGGWGNCMAVEKLDLDLTSCKMNTKGNEQYFGHKNVAKNGKTCRPWKVQKKYTNVPMDNQSMDLVSNYCRRMLSSDSDPWCYTVGGSWAYCSIRTCSKSDWD